MKQPWLYKSRTEWLFIIAPPFACVLVVACFPYLFTNEGAMPTYWWVILILLLDVGHVYSTLYRTYFNPMAWQTYRQPMLWIPILAFLFFVFVYSFSETAFWMCLAYLAVFHFVRQQYGIFQLYRRRESVYLWHKRLDAITIYSATLYPLLYWHFEGTRNFTWFIKDDFLLFQFPALLPALGSLYLLILVLYASKEIVNAIKFKQFNVPKNMVLIGTAVSWYLGIVHFNGDVAFTLFNVVSHSIPYIALIWIYLKKEERQAEAVTQPSFYKVILGQYGIFIFVFSIFLFAYLEEGLWDALVWKEHSSVFGLFQQLDTQQKFDEWKRFLIPLLALPQITHYLIDAVIWKHKNAYQSKSIITKSKQ